VSPWNDLHVTQVPLGRLNPYAGNPRKHSERQIGMVAASIAKFGFLTAIGVDAEHNIVFGHARVLAAQQLGLLTVPVVRIEHLSEAKIRAYRIADNRLAELSEWDEEALRIEITDLTRLELAGDLDLDLDLDLTGFSMPERDVIIDGPGNSVGPEETVELPEPEARAVTRPGDLWQLGPHRILCSSSLEPLSYADLMLEGELARLVFTDPPYNVPIAGHVRTGQGSGHREFAMGVGEMSEEGFTSFLETPLRLACKVAHQGALLMVFMDWKHQFELLTATRRLGLAHLNTVVWNKTNGGMGSLYRSKHELVGVFKTGDAPHINNVQLGKHGRYRTNVWDYAGVNTFRRGREADLVDHPTVKPTALVADAIKDVTNRGGVVLDPFGGSGSTLLAAEKAGRCARLIELDPLYVDVTIRRWQALTGRSAVHVGSGDTFAERETHAAAEDSKADRAVSSTGADLPPAGAANATPTRVEVSHEAA
jgi:DNA modification methylase